MYSYCTTGLINKSTHSNLGRGLRRGTVAHVRRVKSPLITMARPKFAPKVPLPVDRPPNTTTMPHLWTRPTYDAKRHPDPIRRFSIMHYGQTDGRTDRPTHRPTDRPRESLVTIGLTRATRPDNYNSSSSNNNNNNVIKL